MHITRTSASGQALIKDFESLRLSPYLCAAGYPTIGYGSTYYADGRRVTLKDPPISQATATSLFMAVLAGFERLVDSVTRDDVSQHQFDALVSLAYNIGPDNFKKSTLLAKVNANPSDPAIRTQFMRWVHADGKKLAGLVNRREREANLYFTR